MLRTGAKAGLFSLLVIALCLLLRAQEGGVPVVIDGQEIVRVYAPLGPVSVPERAPAIENRILILARRRFAGRVGTRPIPSEKATAVVVGPLVVMTVTELDAEAAGLPPDQL